MKKHNYQLLKFPLSFYSLFNFCLMALLKSSPAQTRTGDPYIISVVL